jgi:hypothetical protein
VRYIRFFRIYLTYCSIIPGVPFHQRLDKLEFVI